MVILSLYIVSCCSDYTVPLMQGKSLVGLVKKLREKALVRSEHFLAGMMICVNLEFPGFCWGV